MEIEQMVNPPKQDQKGWWGWGSSFFASAEQDEDEMKDEERIEKDVQLSREDRETFLEILNLTENIKNPYDLPLDVRFCFSFCFFV